MIENLIEAFKQIVYERLAYDEDGKVPGLVVDRHNFIGGVVVRQVAELLTGFEVIACRDLDAELIVMHFKHQRQDIYGKILDAGLDYGVSIQDGVIHGHLHFPEHKIGTWCPLTPMSRKAEFMSFADELKDPQLVATH